MQGGWCRLGPLQWSRFVGKQVTVTADRGSDRAVDRAVDRGGSDRAVDRGGSDRAVDRGSDRAVDRGESDRAVDRAVDRGWLLTVDPVSASLVLVNFREVGGASVQVLMGHAVQRVDVVADADPQTAARLRSMFVSPRSSGCGPEELRRRREAARRWLQQNRVPVEEEGEELKVAGALTLAAPYGAEDCSSSNQIILDRIQRLLRTGQDQDQDQDQGQGQGPDPDPRPAGPAASSLLE